MDKYAVEIDEEKTKTASSRKTCPKCGTRMDEDNTNYCFKCGTEPFEKRPK